RRGVDHHIERALSKRPSLAKLSRMPIENFLRLLKRSPTGAVFNPWWKSDEANDIGPRAPRIRREQLHAYLAERLGKGRLVLIGEALGYCGGTFNGIAASFQGILADSVP